MNALQISLFGNLTCVYADHPIELEPRKAQELLCYLLLHRDQLHEREKLATLLWAEKSASQSKKYLRQTLWQLQTALNTCPRQLHLLLTDHQQIGINPDADLWLDIAVFDQALVTTDRQSGRSLSIEQAQILESVLPLYTGDLLEGWYQDWCIYERERYQNIYLTALDKLTEYHEAYQQYEAALGYGECILRYDRARERTHRQLMRLQYLAGHRTQALHQYDACVAALTEELGVCPAKSTVALYEEICADQLTAQTMIRSEVTYAPVPESNTQRIDPHQELEQIQATLAALQHQVAQLLSHLEAR